MSSSFDFPELDHLTTGTVGPPGQRVFYLQVGAGSQVVSLRLEKAQVAGLVRYLTTLLGDLPDVAQTPTSMDLVDPVVPEWVVGTLGVSYDEVDDRVILFAEELVAEGEEGEVAERGVARIRATREQASALAIHGAAVVEAGRPTCSLCSQPIDPEGHVCPRLNGHRRSTP